MPKSKRQFTPGHVVQYGDKVYIVDKNGAIVRAPVPGQSKTVSGYTYSYGPEGLMQKIKAERKV